MHGSVTNNASNTPGKKDLKEIKNIPKGIKYHHNVAYFLLSFFIKIKQSPNSKRLTTNFILGNCKEITINGELAKNLIKCNLAFEFFLKKCGF